MRGVSASNVRGISFIVLFLCLGESGCASPKSVQSPETSQDSVEKSTDSAEEGTDPEMTSAPAQPVEASAHPAIDERESDPSRALPELGFKHLGMHIGGESNSPESKAPWLKDIESGTDEILSCYQHVSEPGRVGSYGVDLYFSSQGKVEVRGSRQKIGGAEFDECMKAAFAAIGYHAPGKPTVLSYSLLFELRDPAQ